MVLPLKIGCKLPHGLVLELGLDAKGAPTGAYEVVVLNGLDKTGFASKYGVTTGVSAAFWAAWTKRNKNLRYVKDGSVFVIPEATAK